MMTGMYLNGDPADVIEVGVEKLVGQIKIGNNVYNRYIKIVDFGDLPNNTTKAVAHDISGLTSGTQILSIQGRIAYSSSAYPVPNYDPSSNYNGIRLSATTTQVIILTISTWTGFTAYVTIEYYK